MTNDVVIVTICKNESRYLREFVAYHLGIGFDRIVIGDNNDVNGESYDALLNDYISEGKVQLIDLRGKEGYQKEFYNNITDYGVRYQWAAYIDADEFVTFSPSADKKYGHDIKKFLFDTKNKGIRVFKLNWMMYGDNGKIEYEDAPVIDRFPEPLPDNEDNEHCKSILRGDVFPNFEYSPHATNGIGRQYSPSGHDVGPGPFSKAKDYSVLYIRHYYTKSLQEWCEIKMGRGYADYKRNERKEYYPLKTYFKYNEWTKEKQKFLEEHGYEYKR